MGSLFQENVPVAKPIATNETFQIDITEKWAFAEYREGSHPNRGSIVDKFMVYRGQPVRAMEMINEEKVKGIKKLWTKNKKGS